MHIVFLELVIDPSCSLIFEAEEAEGDLMRRPPRDARERLFTLKALGLALLEGLSSLAVCLIVYFWARPNHGVDAARALTFTALVVSFLAIIAANRSRTLTILATLRQPNPAFWWVCCGTVAFLALALTWPPAQHRFHFVPAHGQDLLLACAVGFSSILWFEAIKVFRRLRAKSINPFDHRLSGSQI